VDASASGTWSPRLVGRDLPTEESPHNAGERHSQFDESPQTNKMHSLLSFILLLGPAAAERKIILGRTIYMRKRTSPKRIQSAQREITVVTKEVTNNKAPRILIEDSFQEDDAPFGGISLSFDFSIPISPDFSMPFIEPPTDTTPAQSTDTTPTPSSVAPPAPLYPNADLASLFAKALVSNYSYRSPSYV
jgi:hypothetical protein